MGLGFLCTPLAYLGHLPKKRKTYKVHLGWLGGELGLGLGWGLGGVLGLEWFRVALGWIHGLAS